MLHYLLNLAFNPNGGLYSSAMYFNVADVSLASKYPQNVGSVRHCCDYCVTAELHGALRLAHNWVRNV